METDTTGRNLEDLDSPRPASFYARDAREVAQDLLGDVLVSFQGEEPTGGPIVETEAYISDGDDANHGVQAGKTARNKSMFGPPGHAYIYLIYGMYDCLNAVCRSVGIPEAVLIRAVRPEIGRDWMIKRRKENRSTPLPEEEIASGPGKLCMALQLDRSLDGISLVNSEKLVVYPGPDPDGDKVSRTPRIGVDYAENAGDWPLRYLKES